MLEQFLIVLIVINIIMMIILYAVSARMLKLRRQKKRSFNFKPYPIPQMQLSSIAPCFALNEYGVGADSMVFFIGGEGVFASLSDRETWVLAGLAKSAKTIFEFGTCSGKTTHVMALNTDDDARLYTLTIHPEKLNELTFPDTDDDHHKDMAELEAKFDKFYYEGHSTEKKINQIFSDSKDYDETDLIGQVDLIFIDGAHTKSYVESDTNKALRMLSPQGVIVWHDYKLDAPDVFHYLNELSRTIEMVHVKDTDMVIYRKHSI
ncbi:class I SAM-dependent methyltransferase [Rhodospirillaceae bacterium]|nr:class I SAM-dependent methyltransferase [Rhodospirillaceae bacterium]MDC0998433.1 class I SAM-dependent methyltransferase [Alphaproteobacteria bacterium]MDC1441443.1 class I SAM-dependent methyltransferase [Rhodospirillaceae bacterium]